VESIANLCVGGIHQVVAVALGIVPLCHGHSRRVRSSLIVVKHILGTRAVSRIFAVLAESIVTEQLLSAANAESELHAVTR
jgi:hypothetical protein